MCAPRPTRAATTHESCASAAAPRCTGCTRSGAAPRAATRPTVAAGDTAASATCAMNLLETSVNPNDRLFTDNRDRMRQLVAELQTQVARAQEGGGAKYIERHRAQGKL